jgi:exonuclease V gamma subunit
MPPEDTRDLGLRQFTASKAHGKTLLALGIDALVWSALGRGEEIDRIVCGEARQRLAPLPPEAARAKLAALLAFAQRARTEALPFKPKAGLNFVQQADAAKARDKAFKSWTSDQGGEGGDRWVATALRGAQPFLHEAATQRFAELARVVFVGLPGVEVSGAGEAGEGEDE